MADYLFLDATGNWSVPTKTNYKYLRADNTWAAPDPNYKFLRADGKWEQMILGPKLGEVANGTLIKFMTLWNKEIQWRVIGKNLTGMPSNAVTLLSDKIIAVLPFDAAEPKNSDSNRKPRGNNDYSISNIRQWLNSTAAAGNWYSAQHDYDQAPDKAHVRQGYDSYDTWAGFLNGSTTKERNSLLWTTRRIGGYSGNGTSCTDRIFLLTSSELGSYTIANNGTKIPYFTDDNSRMAKVTAECVTHDDNPYSPTYAGEEISYWTSTSQSVISSFSSSYVLLAGNLSSQTNIADAYTYGIGVRPACNLSASTYLSAKKDGSGCYTLVL